jgi:hypothetical protein
MLHMSVFMYKVVSTEFSLKSIHSNRLSPSATEVSCLTSIIRSYKELPLEGIRCLRIAIPRPVLRPP